MSKPFRQPSTCEANASLISMMDISSRVKSARFNASLMASTGPTPIILGSTPIAPDDRILAIGLKPNFSSACFEPIISAAAPSLIPDALPAVTTPSLFKGLSFCNASTVELARGCSSSNIAFSGSFLPCDTIIGVISSSKNPACLAAWYLACEAAANLSASSRVIPYLRATLSPVCGMLSLPNCFSMIGLGKRLPMVVSNTLNSRLKGCSVLANTKGARVIDSTPPAKNISPSLQVILRAASIMVDSPEAHKRLTV